MAIRASSRARAAPRQKWMPCPNVRCVLDVPVDVERVAVGRERPVVVVARGQDHHQGAARGHDLAVELDVAGHDATGLEGRRLEPQDLLHRVRDQGAIVVQLAALVGVLGEDLAGVADHPVGRLVAGGGEHVDEDQQLVVGEACGWCRSRPRTRLGSARSSGRRRGARAAS